MSKAHVSSATMETADLEMHLARQSSASDPLSSVWVGASAGTGKTKVLVDRLLRLMLPRRLPDGTLVATLPEKILCITFTKAAAAEMAARVSSVLRQWVTMDDAALAHALETLTGTAADDDMMRAARRLFATVVDVPGRMKIMTIHGFCQAVLRRFPLEAGVSPQFELIDEASASETRDGIMHALGTFASGTPQDPLSQSFMALASAAGDAAGLGRVLQKIISRRRAFLDFIKRMGGVDAAIDAVYAAFGLSHALTVTDITADFCAPDQVRYDSLQSAASALLATSKKADNEKAHIILSWLRQTPATRGRLLNDYELAFLTGEGKKRATLATKDAEKILPDVCAIMDDEAERILALNDRLAALRTARATADILRVGHDILEKYARIKAQKGHLDYDDLIEKTGALLADRSMASWVLYKLDHGIDHILVDEAQDTNLAQWQLLQAIADEFYSGSGARPDTVRTIFVVGDEKQSIYSFQGADVAAFDSMNRYFSARIAEAGQSWRPVDLNLSFRSTPSVLAAVDAIFAPPANRRGLTADHARDITHVARRADDAGHVAFWPLLASDKKEAVTPWQPATSRTGVQSGAAKMAERIAGVIDDWLKHGEILQSAARPIRPSDILILVRSRNAFVTHMMRALKARRIPVAGLDRMYLSRELSVLDLMAIAGAALMPQDDLTLATALKTPLLGYDDDRLMKICIGRDGHVWDALAAQDKESYAYLADLAARASWMRPYDFFMHILTGEVPGRQKISGKAALLMRLGPDCLDPLDEFLNAAVNYERQHVPSLQAFLAWFSRSEAEIKRDQEQAGSDMIRIMTVHGSKGLQAPIVFLPDTTGAAIPTGQGKRVDMIWPDENQGGFLYAPASADEPDIFKKLANGVREKVAEEHRRLLYVALTRAADRLYIGGFYAERPPPTECWYNWIKPVMEATGRAEPDADTGETVYILDNPQTRPLAAPVIKPVQNMRAALPIYAETPAPVEARAARPLAPSVMAGADDAAVASPFARDTNDIRFKRGIIAHHLFQTLPDLAANMRNDAAREYLALPQHGLTDVQQAELAAEVSAVMTHPQFAPIFSDAARGEVPVTGLIETRDQGLYALSGQIDRLLITDDDVLIVDFKTNRPPPATIEGVADLYLRQLAAYRAVMARIYPQKTVSCALLWTDGPHLMPIPSATLDRFAP